MVQDCTSKTVFKGLKRIIRAHIRFCHPSENEDELAPALKKQLRPLIHCPLIVCNLELKYSNPRAHLQPKVHHFSPAEIEAYMSSIDSAWAIASRSTG